MKLKVSQIQKEELSRLMQHEALKEGWVYSQDDVDFYYGCPQNSIYAVKVDNQLAGCVILYRSLGCVDKKPIFSAGLFLVLDDYRGQKTVGPYLWQQAITAQVGDESIVCFHAVPLAVEYYGRLNFRKTPLVNLFHAVKKEQLNEEAIKAAFPLLENGTLKVVSDHDIHQYNNQLFSGDAGRGLREFMQQWIKRPDAIVIGYYLQNDLQGYGVATICNQAAGKITYRISPLYANTVKIAQCVLQGLLAIVSKNPFSQIQLNTLATAATEFGHQLKEIGFIESGKNFVVCNQPHIICKDAPILEHVFCSIPLEYPHEVIAGISEQASFVPRSKNRRANTLTPEEFTKIIQ